MSRCEFFRLPKADYATKGWLLSNEVGPFLDSCQLGFHAIAKFAIFTGLRRREVVFHPAQRCRSQKQSDLGAMLIESGLDVYKVSKLLGHSDVRITEKICAPISGKFLASEASKLGRYMGPLLLREVTNAKSDTAC